MGKMAFAALAAGLCLAGPAAAQAPAGLAARIAHTDPAGYRTAEAVHGGAGSMRYGVLLGAQALETNFLFLHRGVIAPKSGIGQHFHNDCEEMFVILDGEAQFTIDGRTAVLKGPAGAPDQAGHAHGIYNHTDAPVQWLNINVGMSKVYDAFDLGDPRVGAPVDPIPQFMTLRLDRSLLRAQADFRAGKGQVFHRRALGPSVFRTAWSYVDHLVIPPGSEVGPDAPADMSEVYYVLGGEGAITVNGETVALTIGDAVAIRAGEAKNLRSRGGSSLELMIIGVARDLEAKRRFVIASAPSRR